MSAEAPGTTFLDRLKGWFGRPAPRRDLSEAGSVRFQLLYERFREILGLNESVLQLFADLDEMRHGGRVGDLDDLAPRVRRVAMDVFLMAKNLNQIADGRWVELYDVLKAVNARLEVELAGHAPRKGPLVVTLDAVEAKQGWLVGGKMAPLAELRASGRFQVPNAFVITTTAFSRFMEEAGLWGRAERLEAVVSARGASALGDACREVSDAILAAPVPEDIDEAILAAYDALSGGQAVEVAMRSSGVGEDSSLSHAGQYRTELRVTRDGLLDAYKRVVASAYGASAVSYRHAHGLRGREARMAVGCMRMVSPRAAGVLYSRAFEAPRSDVVVISATPGLAEGLVAGTSSAEELRVVGGRLTAPSTLLTQHECAALARLGRELEALAEKPQDVEWAIDDAGAIHVLQARPLSVAAEEPATPTFAAGAHLIASGGQMACPGAAAGKIAHVRGEADLDAFQGGSVLVARHSSPAFARVLDQCAAIVTEVGSPTGHMAILAREAQVPAIVGLPHALELLSPGSMVTVDASGRRVFAGKLDVPPPVARPTSPAAPTAQDSPERGALLRVAELVTPLHLTDPASKHFAPGSCRSLHDVVRFVHEKVFEVMFHFGDVASSDRTNSVKLKAHLPIDVLIYDVGGGLSEASRRTGKATVQDVLSIPGQAFLSGLSDPRIHWDQPRPLSGRGFLSVIGDGLAAPPPSAREVGRRSYAVMSDRYMNFSTKAGYHFSVVDTYCGSSLSKNYIHFRFERGGAAGPRRERRIHFLSTVLAALDFHPQARGDLLVARMEKYDQETIMSRLGDLGRLTLCARQLDMLMDSHETAESYARAFLAGEWATF